MVGSEVDGCSVVIILSVCECVTEVGCSGGGTRARLD